MSVDNSRNILVDELVGKGVVRSAPVESAFRNVARHLFAPEVEPDVAYRNEVIPIEVPGKEGASSVSQPAIVATMLEQLGLPLELWPGLQVCAAFEPDRDSAGEHLQSVAARWCGFMSLRGGLAAMESGPEDYEEELPSGKTALEEQLRALREVSLAPGLSFPEGLWIRVYPRSSNYIPSPQESVIEKQWSTLVLDWR